MFPYVCVCVLLTSFVIPVSTQTQFTAGVRYTRMLLVQANTQTKTAWKKLRREIKRLENMEEKVRMREGRVRGRGEDKYRKKVMQIIASM